MVATGPGQLLISLPVLPYSTPKLRMSHVKRFHMTHAKGLVGANAPGLGVGLGLGAPTSPRPTSLLTTKQQVGPNDRESREAQAAPNSL